MYKLKDLSEIVEEVLNIDPKELKKSSRLKEDLGADSIDVVELLMLMEDKFNLDRTLDKNGPIETIDDVLKSLNIKDKWII